MISEIKNVYIAFDFIIAYECRIAHKLYENDIKCM